MIAVLRANRGLVAVGLIGVALLIALPLALDLFDLLQITLYAILAILALSLAFMVRRMLGQSEILRGLGRARRDDVPARAALAQMIERGKQPRQIIGLRIGG